MSYLGKVYKHQKDENFKEFLDTLGIPEELKQKVLSSRPTQKLEKNGDEYILTTTENDKPKVVKFKNGVEFDENITDDIAAKTTFTVDGDVIKQVRTVADGRSLIIERQYSGDDLVAVVKTSAGASAGASARRFYTAA